MDTDLFSLSSFVAPKSQRKVNRTRKYVTMVRGKTVKNTHAAALWRDTFYCTLNQIPK